MRYKDVLQLKVAGGGIPNTVHSGDTLEESLFHGTFQRDSVLLDVICVLGCKQEYNILQKENT